MISGPDLYRDKERSGILESYTLFGTEMSLDLSWFGTHQRRLNVIIVYSG